MNRFIIILLFLAACKRQQEPPNPFASGFLYSSVKDQLDLSSTQTITGKEGVLIYIAKFKDDPDRYYANSSKGDVLFSRNIIDENTATLQLKKGHEILTIKIEEGKKKITSRTMETQHGGTGFCQRENGETFSKCFNAETDEAYNLLEGRAVYKELENKEGHKYHAWLQLDFSNRDKNNNHEVKQYHQAYGFDLTAALARYNIREMGSPDLRDILVSSLQKGNLQAVAMEKDGGAIRMFVEAAPQFKNVTLYDSDLKRVQKESLVQFQSNISHSNKVEKESNVLTSGKGHAQKNGVQKEATLLPKKREGKNKGLNVS